MLSWTSPALDLSIGRDKVDYGGILQGSIFPSDRLPYLDAFRARCEARSLTLDYMISSQDAIPSWDGIDVDIERSGPHQRGTFSATAGTTIANPTSIIEVYHSHLLGLRPDSRAASPRT